MLRIKNCNECKQIAVTAISQIKAIDVLIKEKDDMDV